MIQFSFFGIDNYFLGKVKGEVWILLLHEQCYFGHHNIFFCDIWYFFLGRFDAPQNEEELSDLLTKLEQDEEQDDFSVIQTQIESYQVFIVDS